LAKGFVDAFIIQSISREGIGREMIGEGKIAKAPLPEG
jgi:hypothetical protein